MLFQSLATAVAFATTMTLAPFVAQPASAATPASVSVAVQKPVLKAFPTKNISSKGATILVKGRNYNPTVGIYVAFCVTPKPGRNPSPCGGGANMGGTNPASYWISSNPPAYGKKLAKPYGRNGSFTVKLRVSPMIGSIDCRKVSCSVVTRADHTHPDDLRFTVAVPVTFK